MFKTVATASLGGALEMYDFVIYIFFAPIIAQLFFPSESHVASLLSTYGVFAVGYLARPLGGVIFGHYGDKYSRKNGLVITIILMAVATVGMGLLPGYATIGVAAPILLFLLRLIQGVAVGGDLSGAITFVAESVHGHHRGLHCAWVFFGVNLGIILASFIGTVITSNLSPAAVSQWGWRLAFLISVILMFVGLYFRHRLAESPVYVALQQQKLTSTKPLKILLQTPQYLRNVIKGIGIIWLLAVIIAQVFLYMPAYLHQNRGLNLAHAMQLNTLALIVFTALIPFMGALSDRLGRRKLLLTGALLFIFLSYPLYLGIDYGHPACRLSCLLVLAIISSIIVGVTPAVLTELFTTAFRYSGVALSYNIGFALFAGLTPLFATWLIASTGNILALVFNLLLAAFITFIAALTLKEHGHNTLDTV